MKTVRFVQKHNYGGRVFEPGDRVEDMPEGRAEGLLRRQIIAVVNEEEKSQRGKNARRKA